jgi:hypothetical protein
MSVYYDGIIVGVYVADLVGNDILVELKAVKALDNVHYTATAVSLRSLKIS